MSCRHVFIAGFPRCGTTTLFDWMADHPDICATRVKETYYFTENGGGASGETYRTSGMSGFLNLFPPRREENKPVLLEGTPSHVYEPAAREALPQLTPLPKMILLVRKPSQRIYSLFNHAKHRLGQVPLDMTFSEFVSLLHKDRERALQTFGGSPALVNSIDQSVYVTYIRRWSDALGADNVRVYSLRDLRKNPVRLMHGISTFLDISAHVWDRYDYYAINRTIAVRSRLLHKIMKRVLADNRRMTRQRFPLLHRFYMGLNARRPHISEEDRMTLRELDDFFAPSVKELGDLLSMDISHLN